MFYHVQDQKIMVIYINIYRYIDIYCIYIYTAYIYSAYIYISMYRYIYNYTVYIAIDGYG